MHVKGIYTQIQKRLGLLIWGAFLLLGYGFWRIYNPSIYDRVDGVLTVIAAVVITLFPGMILFAASVIYIASFLLVIESIKEGKYASGLFIFLLFHALPLTVFILATFGVIDWN